MDNCKHCGKQLIHIDGRKKKEFCDTNCRNKYFYALNKEKIKANKPVPYATHKAALEMNEKYLQEIEDLKKREDEALQEAVKLMGKKGRTGFKGIQDLTKPNMEVKPITAAPETTNITIDTTPKTLEQLKQLCPKNLTSLDRGTWIAAERIKYGI